MYRRNLSTVAIPGAVASVSSLLRRGQLINVPLRLFRQEQQVPVLFSGVQARGCSTQGSQQERIEVPIDTGRRSLVQGCEEKGEKAKKREEGPTAKTAIPSTARRLSGAPFMRSAIYLNRLRQQQVKANSSSAAGEQKESKYSEVWVTEKQMKNLQLSFVSEEARELFLDVPFHFKGVSSFYRYYNAVSTTGPELIEFVAFALKGRTELLAKDSQQRVYPVEVQRSLVASLEPMRQDTTWYTGKEAGSEAHELGLVPSVLAQYRSVWVDPANFPPHWTAEETAKTKSQALLHISELKNPLRIVAEMAGVEESSRESSPPTELPAAATAATCGADDTGAQPSWMPKPRSKSSTTCSSSYAKYLPLAASGKRFPSALSVQLRAMAQAQGYTSPYWIDATTAKQQFGTQLKTPDGNGGADAGIGSEERVRSVFQLPSVMLPTGRGLKQVVGVPFFNAEQYEDSERFSKPSSDPPRVREWVSAYHEHSSRQRWVPLKVTGVPFAHRTSNALHRTLGYVPFTSPVWVTVARAAAIGVSILPGQYGTEVATPKQPTQQQQDGDTVEPALGNEAPSVPVLYYNAEQTSDPTKVEEVSRTWPLTTNGRPIPAPLRDQLVAIAGERQYESRYWTTLHTAVTRFGVGLRSPPDIPQNKLNQLGVRTNVAESNAESARVGEAGSSTESVPQQASSFEGTLLFNASLTTDPSVFNPKTCRKETETEAIERRYHIEHLVSEYGPRELFTPGKPSLPRSFSVAPQLVCTLERIRQEGGTEQRAAWYQTNEWVALHRLNKGAGSSMFSLNTALENNHTQPLGPFCTSNGFLVWYYNRTEDMAAGT